ncbi:response regulator [Paenibacillus alkaliterrae]|uniref:response regulator n=1 Tax=Paenibacillus alkaliterrae TaxID=320909 RepID=UPI001F2E0576|nr:response regulator [Paenibacillus alkaliterrae]MCF2937433.1 response regulator [Paenibacillus alkaliterrae]
MKANDKPLYKVVLIEDDPMVQEVNRLFVEQVQGFQVVGIAGNGNDGLQLVRELSPNLVFLDVFMPSLGGIETLQRLRTMALPVEVVAVTAAKDAETIRTMLRNGAFDYIIKPFKLERVKQTLERYRLLHEACTEAPSVTQDELDRLLHKANSGVEDVPAESRVAAAAPSNVQDDLPKGLNAATLKQVLHVMQLHDGGLSAEEAADGVGIARVTARRYLDYLEKTGRVKLKIIYGGVGRPVNRYVLKP